MIALSQGTSFNLAFVCQVLLFVFIVALVISVGKRIVKARAQKEYEEELMRKQQLEIQGRMLQQMQQQTQMTQEQMQYIASQQNQGRN